ncbi:MAG TPA: family 43 glycosylhydrolase [Thermoleophilaceae bacterium]|nr:family 43 glycosylhydrolase [Thermoleophilaceae bacterium]
MRLGTALGVLLCAFCLAAPAEAVVFELGRADGGAKLVRDLGASKGRALQLIGRERVRKIVSTHPITRLAIRAKAKPCRGWPTLAVRLNGRKVAAFRIRSRRWRGYGKPLRRPAGGHVLDLRLGNPRLTRRCVRVLRLDRVNVTTRRPPRAGPPEAPPPPPEPARVQAPPGHYVNPVYEGSGFADPTVLDVGGTHGRYFAFGTGDRFPVLRSTDLVHWTSAGWALPGRPDWTSQQGEYNPWAPNVIETGNACPGERDGPCYVMFFVSVNRVINPDANCIGVAVSPEPGGPFADRGILSDEAGSTDMSDRPIGCGDDNGYSNIDPDPFVDADGTPYLYLSTGHLCSTPGPHAECPFDRRLSVIPLTDDLLNAAGPRQPLLGWTPSTWEQQIVENPWMRRRGNTYELFYSGGNYRRTYGMGYATASSPTGPFSKAPVNPILRDSEEVLSAGGGSLVTGPRGGEWVAYHGREGDYALPRMLRIDRLEGAPDGTWRVAGPTTTPQPAP